MNARTGGVGGGVGDAARGARGTGRRGPRRRSLGTDPRGLGLGLAHVALLLLRRHELLEDPVGLRA